jgi:hypothetical protein
MVTFWQRCLIPEDSINYGHKSFMTHTSDLISDKFYDSFTLQNQKSLVIIHKTFNDYLRLTFYVYVFYSHSRVMLIYVDTCNSRNLRYLVNNLAVFKLDLEFRLFLLVGIVTFQVMKMDLHFCLCRRLLPI